MKPIFNTGQHIELHPGTDRWMRGDRFGTVLGSKLHRDLDIQWYLYRVKMHRSKQTIRVHEANIGRSI